MGHQPLNYNNVLEQNSDVERLAALYSAESMDSLLVAIEGYLCSLGITPQYSIAFKSSTPSEFLVKHRFDSKYQFNQILFSSKDKDGKFWVSENSITVSQPDVIDQMRSCAVPLYSDSEVIGCLILENHHARLPQITIDSLSTHIARNLAKNELYQLYIRQHQHDSLKLSCIDRMKSVMRELELEKVLTGLIELILSTVSGSAACLVLSCAEAKELRNATEFGVTQNDLASLIHHKFGSISAYVTQKQQAWLTTEQWEFSEFKQCSFLDRLNAFLILPIHVRDGSGCIFIADPENISDNTMEIVQGIVQLSRISIDNALLHTQVLERAVHKQQLELAGEVQNSLMPEFAPRTAGVTVYGLNLPCDDSGGDYYDFIELPDKRLCFVLADATGHGIGASILATTARAMLRALLHNQSNNLDLASICTILNNLLDTDLAADKFITMFIGLYDPFDRTLIYASAGHDPPLLLYQPETDCFTELERTGLPFGMLPNMDYEVSKPIPLEPGTVLTLLSDGVPEAENVEEQMYGKKRLQSFIRTNAHFPPEKLCLAVVEDVSEFRRLAPQTDDITIVILRVDQP